MNGVSAVGIKSDKDSGRTISRALHYSSPCARCGGLMVNHFSTDLLNHAGELEIEMLRCVQCGEVVDSVILRNRLRQVAMTVKNPEPSGRSIARRLSA